MRGFCAILLCVLFSVPLSSQVCGDLICNGGFDSPSYPPPYSSYAVGSTYNCWRTSASDDIIEIWAAGNLYGVPAYNGTNFIEMNGNEAATIYQTFNVSSGVTLNIGFAHLGRGGVDTVQVAIGPVGGPYTILGRWGDDQYAWGYYTVPYVPPSAGPYVLAFTSIYSAVSGYSPSAGVGNFLDAISVNATFNLSRAASTASICAGNTVTLPSSPAANYAWSTGATTSSIVVAPATTTSYSVTGTSGNCSATRFVTVIVRPLPAISIPQPSYGICPGGSQALTASGGVSYTWAPGGFTGNPYNVSPAVNTTYTVTGASAFGCRASTSSTVIIRPLPALSFTRAAITCSSLGAATVAPTGGIGPYTYTWMPGSQTGATASNLNPNTYTLTTFDAGAGCYTSSTTVISPLPAFIATLSSTGALLCNSVNTGTATFSNVMGGSAILNYSWTNGV